MTRIGRFDLYSCPKCQQIHIKSNYSSISIYGPPMPMGIPSDAFYAPTDIKACQKCGEKTPFSEYIPTGHMEPLRFNEKGIDPRKLFPRLAEHPCTTPPPDPLKTLNEIGDESFYQFGRKIPHSWISGWMAKILQKLRSLAD